MTETKLIDVETKIIGEPPEEVDIDRLVISGAIEEKLGSITRRDKLKAIKFGRGKAIEVGDHGLQFLASASVEPNSGKSSEPPMRARVLNVVVTVRDKKVDVDLPFYATR